MVSATVIILHSIALETVNATDSLFYGITLQTITTTDIIVNIVYVLKRLLQLKLYYIV